jgi:hypothetical protein
MWYLVVFLACLAVDSIPVFAPPAWMVMVFLLVKFDLVPWLVIPIGVAGCTLGRLLLSIYIVPWMGKKALGKKEDANLAFLGKQLSKSRLSAFIFVFVYSMTPLSTTALFTAVGLARVKKLYIIPPFMLGRRISDGALILSGKYAFSNMSEAWSGAMSVKGVALGLASLLVILLFLFVDWRVLLTEKKLKLDFRFWK